MDLKDKREEHDEIDYENIEYDAKEEIAQVEIQEAVNAQDDTYYNEFVEQKGRTVEIFTQAEAQEEATITCKSKSTIAIERLWTTLCCWLMKILGITMLPLRYLSTISQL